MRPDCALDRQKQTNVCAFDCAAPCHQPRYCDRRRTVLVRPDPVATAVVPCGNYHHSQEDYRWWARLMAPCLRLSWAERPPDVTWRVKAFGLTESEISLAEAKFLVRLRRRGVSYGCFREWQAPGRGRHLHLAVRAGGSKLDTSGIGDLWRSSLPPGTNATCYAAPIDNLIGLARYLTGDCAKHIVLPPPEVRFIFGARRDFLVRPLTKRKQEVKAAWRGCRDEWV